MFNYSSSYFTCARIIYFLMALAANCSQAVNALTSAASTFTQINANIFEAGNFRFGSIQLQN